VATSYAFALQELLQRLNQTYGNLDDETQNVTTATQRGLFDARKEKDKTTQATAEGSADRGMLNSGIAIGEQADVKSRYDQLMSRLEGDQSNALSSIARRRQQATTGYTQGKTEIERQEYEANEAARALEEAKKAEAQVELAKTNPSAAGISVGATYNSPDEYSKAALAYQDAQAQDYSRRAQEYEQADYANRAREYAQAIARNRR